jgi:hypothetical protein
MGKDAFEQQYMEHPGLLHREKSIQKYHWISAGLAGAFLLAAVIVTVSAAFSPVPLGVAALSFLPGILMGVLWAMFSVLRVHVTTEKLVVQLGPRGLHIPLGDIESARVVPRQKGRYHGGKVRLGADGKWEYFYMMTNADELVEVHFRRKGKGARLQLTSPDPHALVRTILRAKTGASPAVRVEDAVEAVGEEEAEEVARAEERRRA